MFFVQPIEIDTLICCQSVDEFESNVSEIEKLVSNNERFVVILFDTISKKSNNNKNNNTNNNNNNNNNNNTNQPLLLFHNDKQWYAIWFNKQREIHQNLRLIVLFGKLRVREHLCATKSIDVANQSVLATLICAMLLCGTNQMSSVIIQANAIDNVNNRCNQVFGDGDKDNGKWTTLYKALLSIAKSHQDSFSEMIKLLKKM